MNAKLCEAIIEMLDAHGVKYVPHGNGKHLVITEQAPLIDFWPTTNNWTQRGTHHRGYGLGSLLKFLGFELGERNGNS